MLFRQLIHDDLGCASYLIGDRGQVWPRWSIRGWTSRSTWHRALPRRAHRARAGDPHPRRPRLGPRAAGRGHRGDDPRAPPGRGRVPARGLRGRLGAVAGVAAGPGAAHAWAPARAHGLPADRHGAGRGAVGRAHRGLAVRRRRRAARPGGGPGRGRPRPLPLAARAADGPAGRGRGLAGPPGRLDVRRAGDGHEDLVDDRLRAPPRRPLAPPTRTPSPSGCWRAGPQPPNFQAIVERNRGPLSLEEAPGAGHAARAGAAGRGRAQIVDVRSDRQYDEAHVPGAVCSMLHAGFGTKLAWVSTSSPTSSSSGATRPTGAARPRWRRPSG